MKSGSSSSGETDFDAKFREVCESTMRGMLGENALKSFSWWLARAGVSLSDSSLRPQEFDDALVDLFHPMGALLIETRILARFYRIQGAKYQRSDSIDFGDEVKKARQLFEGNG